MSRFKAMVKNVLTAIISLIVTSGMWLGIAQFWSYICNEPECLWVVSMYMPILGIPVAIVVFLVLLFVVSSVLTKIGTWIGKSVKRKRKPKTEYKKA